MRISDWSSDVCSSDLALHSWLEMDIIDRMQNEGLISQDEFSAIAQGFVDAYNEGRLTQQQAETFLQVASLQQAAPGIVDKQFTQMREFLAAAGDSEATRTFRENFAESLLARALNQHNGAIHAPGLAMQIAADSGDPDMAARVFNDVLEANGGSDATRAKLLDSSGQSSLGFRNSQGVVDGLVTPLATDRKSLVSGKSVSVRVYLGGRPDLKKKKQ